MENNIKIEKSLIKEDILMCVEILNSTLIEKIGDKNYLSYRLKKEKNYNTLNKAKAAVARLTILLDEFSKE